MILQSHVVVETAQYIVVYVPEVFLCFSSLIVLYILAKLYSMVAQTMQYLAQSRGRH